MSDRLPGLYLPKCTPGKAAECRTSLISFFFITILSKKNLSYLCKIEEKKKKK